MPCPRKKRVGVAPANPLARTGGATLHPTNPTLSFVLTRAVHLTACLLLLSTCVFDRFVLPRQLHRELDINSLWRPIARVLLLISIPFALASGAAWLGLVAIEMSGLPAPEALTPDVLRTVWTQTRFGLVWQLHALFWAMTAIASLPLLFRLRPSVPASTSAWLALISAVLLCASLAWSGHGTTGAAPALHLPADIIHLIVTACWPTGLLPFGWLLLKLRRSDHPQSWRLLATITRRFSAMSLLSAALLLGTGIINTWALIGSVSNLFRTAYGKMLLFKIALFVLMTILGAINLLRLKPRILVEPDDPSGRQTRPAARLQLNVAAELLPAAIIMIVVAMLGLLPPGVE